MHEANSNPEQDLKKNLIAMRRTNRISWMISGWIVPVELGPNAGGTASLTIGCPDDFYAVRLGFASSSTHAWKITKVIGCASSSFGDYVNPADYCTWTPFTFTYGGSDSDDIVTHSDAATEIRVSGNNTEIAGEADNHRWTWTDWAPIANSSRDPVTGMRVLMLRALVPSAQHICFANSQLRALTGNKTLNGGFDYFVGGLKFNIDQVSNPSKSRDDLLQTQSWQDNQLAAGSLFPIVQFKTENPGIVGITTGDSHHQGTGTTDQFTNYLYRATTLLGSEYTGKIPFGMVNCATGGATSEQFFSRLAGLLKAVQPSYAILPGWTYNNMTGTVHADGPAVDRFVTQLMETIELCRADGVVPIVLMPLPRDADKMSSIQLGPWRALRQTINAMKSTGVIVIDATELLGAKEAGEFTGTYRPYMSNDGAHPNDVGHSVIASQLIALLRRACDASA